MKKSLILRFLTCLALILHHRGGCMLNANTFEQEAIEDVYLKNPNLSEDCILGYNVGIRPYRKSGIRLEAEYLKGKLVIHNYGYGGSGLTLSLGGSQEVVSILKEELRKNPDMMRYSPSIAILGAGVIGLSSAYELLIQGYRVTIYADQFSPNLTSNVAAGIWSPPAIPTDASEEQKRVLARILDTSTHRFQTCLLSDNPEFAGVRLLTAYTFKADTDVVNEASKMFQHSHEHEETVRVHFDNGIVKIGKRKQVLGLDGKLFMEDLFSKVQSHGGLIAQRLFKTIEDVEALSESIIINCTSLGSRELFKDQEFTPIRGHVVYLHLQEDIDYMISQNVPHSTNYWTTLYPWCDRLILGGVFEEGEENCVLDQHVIETLISNARNFLNISESPQSKATRK